VCFTTIGIEGIGTEGIGVEGIGMIKTKGGY
jgi:hypothetical protein